MFSMTKSSELDEVQSKDGDVNKRHYGEDVKFYQKYFIDNKPPEIMQRYG